MALQLLVLAVFGVVDQPLASYMLARVLEIWFRLQLHCKFEIMECTVFIVFNSVYA